MELISITIIGVDRVGVLEDIMSKLKKKDFDITSINFDSESRKFGGRLSVKNPRNISKDKIQKMLLAIPSITTVEVS